MSSCFLVLEAKPQCLAHSWCFEDVDACKQPPCTVKSEFAVGCVTISTSGSWVVWYFCEANWAMFCVCFASSSSLFPFGIPHGWLWKFPHPMSVSCQFHKLCCCCLLSRSLHRRACSHYEKYPLLHKISHTKLSWGEAAPMVVLSRSGTLRSSFLIVPRHQTLFPMSFLYWLPEQRSFSVFLQCFISVV